MTLDRLIQKAQERKGTGLGKLRDAEYRRHYPLIRDAVKQGVSLRSAILILQEEEGAFPKGWKAAHAAYMRAFKYEGIKIGA